MSALPAPRHSGNAAIAAAVALAVVGTGVSLQHLTALRAGWPPEADTFYMPSANTLRVASLGHSELAADVIASRAYVYFGTQIALKGQHRWTARYVNTALDLDPHYHRLYLSGPAMLIYNGRVISIDGLLEANKILERGMKIYPLDWELMFQLGFNLMFELPGQTGEDDPRVPGWRDRGIELLRQTALFEGVPSWLPNLVARMLSRRGRDELAIRHLEQAYAVASEEGRREIRGKLAHLRALNRAQQLEEERKRFEQLLQNGYPYAPEAFSVIAGPRRDRSVHLDARP
jgi:hypothetical protein